MQLKILERSREIGAGCSFATRISQSFERLVGAAFNGSLMNDFNTRGTGYFFKQGYKGWSDGTFIFNDRRINKYREIAELEMKVLDCSSRTKETAFLSLCKSRGVQEFFNLCIGKGKDGTAKDRLHKDRAKYWVLIAGYYEEDRRTACLKIDPSMYTGLTVIAYKRIDFENDITEYKKALKHYPNFNDFALDVLTSQTFEDYFETQLSDVSKNEIFELFYDQKYIELRGRLFDRMQFLQPAKIMARVVLREMINKQIEAGMGKGFEGAAAALSQIGINETSYLQDFLERGWIKEHENEYQVYFETIIQDLYKSKAEAAVRSFGLPIR
jgi:hypothetical protein